jgi:hypothetical protein
MKFLEYMKLEIGKNENIEMKILKSKILKMGNLNFIF